VLAALALGAAAGCVSYDDFAVIAHRGASWDAPEHTFFAFDLALAVGARWIEQDVQMTRDGHLVVIHDETLNRTASGPRADCTGPVRERTLAQLQRCEVGRWFNREYPVRAQGRFEGAIIPTLDSVLTRYRTRARFYIETKLPDDSGEVEKALYDALRSHGFAGPDAAIGRVIVQSFSAASLQRMHDLDATIPLVQLLDEAIPADSLDAVFARIARYAIGIGPSRRIVSQRLVNRAHARGLVVHPYTVNDPAAMDYLLGLGVDGMFTDRPQLLLAKVSP
jgi:glycerophosphoryl diester phosphodiesterase